MSGFLHKARTHALAQIAGGEPASQILRAICLGFEREIPGSVVGVTILDRTSQLFEHAVFPSLSDDYAAALKGIQVADKPGTCALAVFEGKTVECTDVASDARFSEAWRMLGVQHGLTR